MRRRQAGCAIAWGVIAVALAMAARTDAVLAAARRAGAADSALVTAGDAAYDKQDWAQAALKYGAFTRRFQAAGRTWYRLGASAGALGRWPEAIAAYRQADAMGVPPMFAAYNLACAYARAGQVDSSFAVLGHAIDRGWSNPQALDSDADLAALRGDPRFAALHERADRARYPCKYRPESRAFDFWVGDWEVHDNQHGQGLAGHSHVERIVGDCVIFENWTGTMGGTGKSFNSFNTETGTWQQNWMDDVGDVSNFEDGHVKDGTLSFVAHKKDAAGKPFLSRLTFFDLGPDEVRQLGEQSSDDGKTWTVRYDFDYRRVAPK